MNEQLRKAIEEATRVEPWTVPRSIMAGCEYAVDETDHDASQAKLLRVIELLVQQRNERCQTECIFPDEAIAKYDAELIAALEGER